MPLLELEDVEARYGPIKALHGVALTVDEGQMVSLLGANGAGKTTTLRAISGIVRKSGKLHFAGRPLPRAADAIARLGIAHVPEGREIYGEMTVWENILVGSSFRRDRREARRDCEEVLENFPGSRTGGASRPGRSPAASSRCSPSRGRSWPGRSSSF
jgi:branched-chain amino acid transport system ATP-binding protein